jgi:3-hydroxyisobutyrate dehydrogenase-like beta-hydroxyacid dehydrogenase
MVLNVEASRSVWLAPDTGAMDALPTGAIAVESSTITVEWARELAGIFAKQGKQVIDAPVSGSRKQADVKELIFLVGGEAAAVERATPILLAIGKLVQPVGPAGSGIAMKLMVNASMGAQVAAVVELLAMAERVGVDAAKAMEVYNSTPLASPWIKANTPAMLARDYAPQFTVALIEKDLGYAVQAAGGGAQVPITQATQQAFAAAITQGLAGENLTALAEVYRGAQP